MLETGEALCVADARGDTALYPLLQLPTTTARVQGSGEDGGPVYVVAAAPCTPSESPDAPARQAAMLERRVAAAAAAARAAAARAELASPRRRGGGKARGDGSSKAAELAALISAAAEEEETGGGMQWEEEAGPIGVLVVLLPARDAARMEQVG